MENRLLRNEHDKVLAGVSSGLADYMQVDVTIIRLLFVLSTIFLVGTGILVYIVMWIIVPVNNDPAAKFSKFNDYFKKQQSASGFNPPPFGQSPFQQAADQTETKTDNAADWNQNPLDFKAIPKNNGTGRTVGGLFLLVMGLYFLMNEFDFIPYWVRLDKLWPLVFVAIGLSFILKSKRKDSWKEWSSQQNQGTTYTEQQKPAAGTADDLPKQAPPLTPDQPLAEPFEQTPKDQL